MRTIARYLRLYFLIEAQYIKAQMQYRADFFISSIGMFFNSLITLSVFVVLFETIPSLAGWSLIELVFIYAFYLIALSPMQIFFDNIWFIRFQVQSGDFLKYYFRPLNMLFYYMSDRFDIKGLTQLAAGIALMVYASVQLRLEWTADKLLLLGIAVFGGSLVVIAVAVTAGCAAFWVINSYPMLALAWKLREFAPYPITIFDGVFRFLFTFVIPIGFIAFYPAQFFLRPGEISAWIYLSPIIGIGLFALMYRVWTLGVNSYTGTGS
ncbi:MAG: ABC-2 family transporter protein [Anaerolineales bacterium]|nr:ABC-2 family transporter protein [Anaerolineales bacterium]